MSGRLNEFNIHVFLKNCLEAYHFLEELKKNERKIQMPDRKDDRVNLFPCHTGVFVEEKSFTYLYQEGDSVALME